MTLNEEIQLRLQTLAPTTLILKDDSHLHAGHARNQGGSHFTLTIESAAFLGKSSINRHRMVYQQLQDLMPNKIHALSIQAIAPDDKKL